ncbi:PAS domain S-box protein [Tardiphaga sp. 866_E4_N2_1]|jgi:PAS domain S-box-containing protein|uniref:hybrid sensor histidine kinase/response regulator n=1 Tax=Tardiphaga TaxID=1395974 RepID=UPI0015861DEB|nr:PAS domain-containing sensor histidine kinase [Tardiphaga robiniae]NUU44434.1 PAS domain S-box protein [Tardiphaga robiniae]
MAETNNAGRGLFESERAFRLLVQGVTDYAIYLLDLNGIVSNWNTGAEKIKGYSADEIVGQHFSVFYPPEDREAGLPAAALEAARRDKRFEAEGWRMRKDGSRFFASVVIDAIYEDGVLVGFAKITRDITERMQARFALNESENHFRLLVGNVTDYALYMLDPEGRITSWNLGGQRIKGYLPEEIIGQHFSRFYTPGDREAGKPARALETARKNGRYEEEGLRVRKDGTFFWASVVIDPVRNDAGELIGFAKITRDITERRLAVQQLENMQRQLAESQKMDALGQLTGGVAHDFNNLLMAVTGNARLIKRHAIDPRVVKAAEAIEASVRRGAALTRQLLTFARRQQVDPVLLDVGETVQAVREVLATVLGSAIKLEISVPAGVWPVFADPTELETAIINLGINSRDAMPDGGTLTITAENHRVADGEDIGEHVNIKVIDTGAGIPEDVIAKVFDPFFTTKPVGKGTGLGLSQVHGFVNQAGGSVEIKSKLGAGTEIVIRLPRGEGHAGVHEAEVLAEGAGTVLLVEDNPDVATSSTVLLEELGYRVKWVTDAESAMREIERDGIDIVFSDIVMPGKLDGLGLARNLRRSHPHMPVVLATGYSDASRKSGSEFLLLRKPYELHELSNALETARSSVA